MRAYEPGGTYPVWIPLASSTSAGVSSLTVSILAVPDAATAIAMAAAVVSPGRSATTYTSVSPKAKWKLSSEPPFDAVICAEVVGPRKRSSTTRTSVTG